VLGLPDLVGDRVPREAREPVHLSGHRRVAQPGRKRSAPARANEHPNGEQWVAEHGPVRDGSGCIGRLFAALDLYSTEPRLRDRLDLHEIDRHVAASLAALLSTCLDEVHGDVTVPDATPAWYETAAGRRHDVWVAIGMVMGRRPRRTSDALSLLRAHAFAQDRSLDDLAADITAHRVPLDDFTD